MKTFISGATGFVGGHLAEDLIRQGHQIRTLVRPYSDASFIRDLGVDIVYGDLVDYSTVRAALEGCELAYHTAAATPAAGHTKPVYYDVNVRGTDNIMRAAVETAARHVVHCSTVAVHGQPRRTAALSRKRPRPDGFYAATKLESERIALEYAETYGLSVTIARLTRIYGPRDLSWLRVFQDVLNGHFVMIGSGGLRYHLTYIDDIVRGLLLCGESRNASGRCYVIGSDEVRTLGEFINMIAEEGGVNLHQRRLPITPFKVASVVGRGFLRPFGVEPGLMHKVNLFTEEHFYDISKAEIELGYHAGVSLREGIRRTLAWYRGRNYL